MPNDDILKGFRREAGLPAPGNDMRGWCAKTSAVIFGQLLSGMARLSRATGDDALRDKAIALFEGWRETIGPDGDARMWPYAWEKLVCGLVDLQRYADYDDALPTLEATTAWASRTFDRTRRLADEYDFWGAEPGDTHEWYTLPENLYRAYLLTGNPLFKEFADVWRYEDYWGQFAETSQLTDVVPVHAYSHVNTFSSAAMVYAVYGDPRYLDICVNAYEFLQRTQCYATGGYGPDERFMGLDGQLGRSLELYAGHAEIPCGAWAAFKLSRYLMGFTGEARFGDWIETLLYNGIGAALPTEPDGKTYYYGDYRLSSGIKQHYWYEWPCCSGTYLQTVADYHNVIYFHDPAGLSVNLFVPSEVTWQQDGQTVRLRQETRYPAAETTDLTLHMERPLRFRLRLRVPGWCEGFSLRLNDAPLAVDGVAGDWATIEREWQPNDRVTARFPMELRMVAGRHASPAPGGDHVRTDGARSGRSLLSPPLRSGTGRRAFVSTRARRGDAALPHPGHGSRAPLPLAATFFRIPGVLALLDLLRPRRRAALLNRHGHRCTSSTATDSITGTLGTLMLELRFDLEALG